MSEENLTTLTEKSTFFTTTVGRRKEAVALVRLMPGTGQFIVNNKDVSSYFQNDYCALLEIKAPFQVLENSSSDFKLQNLDIRIKVQGGGLIGQAEASKLGLARAICQLLENSENSIRKSLKIKGYLTQDARSKERRKYGLKKARKASQYHKR
nr:ribosomal protein S9 [Elakatothrix viridis]